MMSFITLIVNSIGFDAITRPTEIVDTVIELPVKKRDILIFFQI